MRCAALVRSSLLAVLVGVGGCWYGGLSPTSETAAVAPAPRAGAAVRRGRMRASRALVIVYGRMSYVLDSPTGQADKAERALRESDLVHRLTAAGWAISYRYDDGAGDEVWLISADGRELGGARLEELDGKPAPRAILARAE